jgi:hypothetical protein
MAGDMVEVVTTTRWRRVSRTLAKHCAKTLRRPPSRRIEQKGASIEVSDLEEGLSYRDRVSRPTRLMRRTAALTRPRERGSRNIQGIRISGSRIDGDAHSRAPDHQGLSSAWRLETSLGYLRWRRRHMPGLRPSLWEKTRAKWL